MEQYTQPKNEGETTPSAEQFDSQTFFKNHLVKGEDGSLNINGENLNPMELALLETEKRRRGSQAASSRDKARADKVSLELEKVKEGVIKVQPAEAIDPALKFSDPDEYIRQVLESKNSNPYQEVFSTASEQATQEAGKMTVDQVIANHNQTHPDKQVTLEMLEYDLPPRLVNEFQSGKMSPSDFLEQASDILYRPTTIANPSIPVMPDLGTVAGQTTPTDDGSDEKLIANYASAVI